MLACDFSLYKTKAQTISKVIEPTFPGCFSHCLGVIIICIPRDSTPLLGQIKCN